MKTMERKSSKKFKRLILTPIYAIVVLCLFFFVCLQLASPNVSVKVFGFQTYLISYTGSMEPKLEYNDLIVVKKYDFSKLKEHDIITFKAKTNSGREITITHEIVEIFEDDGVRMLRTKGLAQELPDLIPVTEDGKDGTNVYIGKYAGKNRFIGNLIAYLKSPSGLIALLINILSVILIYYTLTTKNEKTRLEKTP